MYSCKNPIERVARNLPLKGHVCFPLVTLETVVMRLSNSRNIQSCNHLHFKDFRMCKTELTQFIRFNYSRPVQTTKEEMGEERCFSCHHMCPVPHLEPPPTGTARGQRYCRSVPWHPLWVQQMSSRLEGHTLPGLLWDSRQRVIEFNTSLFSPQLCVQGPCFKLFLVTFCFVPRFLHLIYTQFQLCCSLDLGWGGEAHTPTPEGCWCCRDHQVEVYLPAWPPWWKC